MPTPTPQAARVFLIVMENESYSAMVGSTDMPYLNSLIPQGGIADNFFANTHPSIGNYFMLTTGKLITSDDSGFNDVVTDNNLVRAIRKGGKDWKAYIEDLPSIGYTGKDVNLYAKHHNPFAYLSDIVNDTNEANKMVPFTQFASDLASGNLPDFVYLLPDQVNNMHDCPMPGCSNPDKLRTGDDWLKANLQAILNSAAFQQRPTLVILTLDEADFSDDRNGGGQVVTLMLGSKAKMGFRSNNFYQHESLLRLMLEVLELPDRPGASDGAPSMSEFLR